MVKMEELPEIVETMNSRLRVMERAAEIRQKQEYYARLFDRAAENIHKYYDPWIGEKDKRKYLELVLDDLKTSILAGGGLV